MCIFAETMKILPMISFDEALKIIKGEPFTPESESGTLDVAPGRVLAEDVFSDIDMPPFDKSAMDGFACRRSDLGNRLEVIETVRAGDIPEKVVGKNQCTRIMTGARVPDGSDCVIMVEYTEKVDDSHIRFAGSKTENNIAYRGEDIKKGDRVLTRGCLLRPQHIAILAAAGCTKPSLYRKPRVAVLTTGDEIVEPDSVPTGTSIRNSNGPQLIAQARSMGAAANYLGIVEDTPEATRSAVMAAVSDHDVLIITGGVSMGDFDYVPGALRDTGVRLFFEKVAVKPGRPTVFGRKDNVFVFGLPGNPVSSFIIFELMVKPLLYRMMGHEFLPPVLRLPIGVDYGRKKADRVSWSPVSIGDDGLAMPLAYHGSGHINSLGDAGGLMAMAPGVSSYKKGDIVDVRQI
jgi:molybdopterin molybdotransferase